MKKTLIAGLIVIMISMTMQPCLAYTESLVVTVEYYGPAWDINHEGVVNYLDISSLISHYGESGSPGFVRDDIDNSGQVNYLDISVLISHYGESWLVV